MKKKRIVIAGLAAIAAAAMIGGTWAVWTQTLLTKNEFMTAKYSTVLEEEFESPGSWLPGEEEKKAVWVQNDSTIPIIAKVTMNQDWFRREDVTAVVQPGDGSAPVEQVVAKKGEALSLKFTGENGEEFAAILNFNKNDVVVLADSRAAEPGLRLNINEVSSLKEAEGKWLLLSEEPDELGNYTFYYMGMVQPGEKTPVLLESVRMNPQLEATVTGSYTHFEKLEDGSYKKVITQYTNSKVGYDSSHYTLNINMQTVQATKDAVDSILHWDRVTEYIAGYIAGDGVYESASVKKLFFTEKNGIMTYEPYRDESGNIEGGNWFMSFTNMAPGGVYKDKLLIENNCRSKDFKLYMKIIPRDNQTVLQDELLKKIEMNIYYKDQLLYHGDATGIQMPDSKDVDMQNLVPLGIFRGGEEEEIRVELKLDPQLGLNDDGTYKYADILTKIDWQFMVQEYTSPDKPDKPDKPDRPGRRSDPEPDPGNGETIVIDDEDIPLSVMIPDEDVPLWGVLPATGDDYPIIPLTVTAVGCILLMAVFGILGFGKKKEAE